MTTDPPWNTLAEPIGEDAIPPVHQETLSKMLSLFSELPGDRVRLELVHERPSWSKLVAIPSNDGAATIEIWFYGKDDPQDVSPVAGKNAGLNLSSDLFGEAEKDWQAFLQGFVRGVIEGTLVETLEYHGKWLVKSSLTVSVGDELFTFVRTNVPNWLKGLFKKREQRTISYAPYVAE